MDLSPPLAAVAGTAPAGYRPNVWATKDAWDGHRALISHLYADRSLPEVMCIMEAKHGFKATLFHLPTYQLPPESDLILGRRCTNHGSNNGVLISRTTKSPR